MVVVGGWGGQMFWALPGPTYPNSHTLSLCHTLYPWSRVWSTWKLVQQLGLQNW